jgi:hypothetical protein
MAESDFQDEPPQPKPQPPRPPARRDDEFDEDRVRRGDGGVEVLIPYKNPKSLVAYYCGVFSLIPCMGLILGPIALIFGILAMRYAQKNPTARGAGHAITGIILGSLTTLGNWGVLILMLVAGGLAALR